MVKIQPLPLPDKLDCTLIEDRICLLTDEGSLLTVKLAQSLVEQGWKVVALRFPESIIKERVPLPRGINRVVLADMSEEHLQQQLEAISNNYGAIGAFIHLSPLTTTSSNAKAILKQLFLIAKYLQKSLNAAAKQGRSWFVTVSRMNGKLGVGEETNFNPIDGGLFGLIKTLNLEWKKVFCRAIDLSPNLDTQTAVNSIIAELYEPNLLITEVGYTLNQRITLVANNSFQ